MIRLRDRRVYERMKHSAWAQQITTVDAPDETNELATGILKRALLMRQVAEWEEENEKSDMSDNYGDDTGSSDEEEDV